jgi:hypothetical protein
MMTRARSHPLLQDTRGWEWCSRWANSIMYVKALPIAC